jgi:hypothetical protein
MRGMTEERRARLGVAFMFSGAGATIRQAARLAWDDDVFAALTGTGGGVQDA